MRIYECWHLGQPTDWLTEEDMSYWGSRKKKPQADIKKWARIEVDSEAIKASLSDEPNFVKMVEEKMACDRLNLKKGSLTELKVEDLVDDTNSSYYKTHREPRSYTTDGPARPRYNTDLAQGIWTEGTPSLTTAEIKASVSAMDLRKNELQLAEAMSTAITTGFTNALTNILKSPELTNLLEGMAKTKAVSGMMEALVQHGGRQGLDARTMSQNSVEIAHFAEMCFAQYAKTLKGRSQGDSDELVDGEKDFEESEKEPTS